MLIRLENPVRLGSIAKQAFVLITTFAIGLIAVHAASLVRSLWLAEPSDFRSISVDGPGEKNAGCRRWNVVTIARSLEPVGSSAQTYYKPVISINNNGSESIYYYVNRDGYLLQLPLMPDMINVEERELRPRSFVNVPTSEWDTTGSTISINYRTKFSNWIHFESVEFLPGPRIYPNRCYYGYDN